MRESQMLRRSGLAIVAALALLLAGCVGAGRPLPSDEASRLRIATVRVDTSRLAAQGWGIGARDVASRLGDAVRSSFSDRIDGRNGATLVVRVIGINMPTYVGGSGMFGHPASDSVESEAVLVGPRGDELARYPMLSALPATSGGAWYDPANEVRRLDAALEHHAQWLRNTIIGRR